MLNTRLCTPDPRLRVLLIQTLGDAALSLASLFKLAIQGDTHPLAEFFQHGLLTGEAQLRMLLLQPVIKLGKTPGAVSNEKVHRHLKTLLSGLDLAQQFRLVATDDFRGGRGGRGA